MRVERLGKKRIILQDPVFHPETARKARRIMGARPVWDKTSTPHKFKHWTFSLDYTACLQLREEFGSSLEIGPELRTWAAIEKKRRHDLNVLANSTSFDLPTVSAVSPRLAEALASRPYQQVGAAFLARAGRALIADDAGLGKTPQIIAAIVTAGITGPIALAAPSAAARMTWPEELSKWLPGDRYFVATPGRAERAWQISQFINYVKAHPKERVWFLANFEVFRASKKWGKLYQQPSKLRWGLARNGEYWHHPFADLFNVTWSALIADESHLALITQQSAVTRQKRLDRAGMALLRTKPGAPRYAASGTPNRGKRQNLWGTLNWLDPDSYPSYWNWIDNYFDVTRDGFDTEIHDINPAQEKRLYSSLDGIMIRRTKAEVVKDLPPKVYSGVPLDEEYPDWGVGHWLEMGELQAKFYEEMEQKAQANLDSGMLMATGVFAEMTRLKQFASSCGDLKFGTRMNNLGESVEVVTYVPQLPSNKFDWLLNFLKEHGILPDASGNTAGKGKAIIASHFSKIIRMFARELRTLGVPVHTLTGATSDKNRRAAKEAFQAEGGPRLFLLNTTAGGVSLTLDAADDVIILDETWEPDSQSQVEDRAHRVSRIHSVTVHYLRSLGTIEETIASKNESLDYMQKAMMDGRRGVDYAKTLLRR